MHLRLTLHSTWKYYNTKSVSLILASGALPFLIPALLIYYFVRVDIKMYNHIKGPFHYKVSQVSDVITDLSRVKSWRWGPFYRDRIQAELKPGSIRGSQLKKVNNTEAYFLQIVSPHFYIQVPRPDLDEWFKAEHGRQLLEGDQARLKLVRPT